MEYLQDSNKLVTTPHHNSTREDQEDRDLEEKWELHN